MVQHQVCHREYMEGEACRAALSIGHIPCHGGTAAEVSPAGYAESQHGIQG